MTFISKAHSKINMKIDISKKDIYFQFDSFQITQAFNNIIKNAVEAVYKYSQSIYIS